MGPLTIVAADMAHNLAHFWERRGLIPKTAGFPMPLLETYRDAKEGVHNEMKKFTEDLPREWTLHRNLLAGELYKESTNLIRLWAVNDLSDRKTLAEYTLKISKPNSKRSRLITLKETVDFPVKTCKFNNDLFELRAYQSTNEEGKVFARGRSGLFLCDTGQNDVQMLYKGAICSFMQIPTMEDEIVVLEPNGMLWWGELGECFSRIKTALEVKTVSSTDHPRIILASDGTSINFLDLREDNRSKAQAPFFKIHTTVEERYPYLEIDPTDKNYRYLVPADSICHTNYLFEMPYTCMVTTERHHILLDERMPGKKILEIGNAQFRGGDFYLSAQPFRDPVEGGLVYSYFGLSHTIKESLTQWSLYFHNNLEMWSSLGPIYGRKTPHAISDFTKNHLDFDRIDEKQLPEFTRAIHYQSLPETSSNHLTRAFLFRMMDDGEIWYENVVFSPELEMDNDDKASYRNQAIKQIYSYLKDKDERSTQERGVPEWALQSPMSKCEVYNVSFDLNELQVPDTNTRFSNPRSTIGRRHQPSSEISQLEMISEVDERQILSDCILKQWKKVSDYCNGLITEKIEYKYINDTYIGKWTPGIRQVRNLNEGFEKIQRAFKHEMSPVRDVESIEEPMEIDENPEPSNTQALLRLTNFVAEDLKPSFSNQNLLSEFKPEAKRIENEEDLPYIDDNDYDFDVDLE
uniref:Uncharacterized protein n=1 Tax=Acrobeloides nanus TaxID=290746 RepID=A0A914CFP8_9BILA